MRCSPGTRAGTSSIFWLARPRVKSDRTLLEFAELIALSPSDDTFDPRLHVLKEQVEHHHKEEGDLFPKVRKLFDHDDLPELGEEMEAERKTLEAGKPSCLVLGQTEEATASEPRREFRSEPASALRRRAAQNTRAARQ